MSQARRLVSVSGWLSALLAAAWLLLSLAAGAGAQSSMMIGIDMQPGTNSISSLGELQTCREVAAGESFEADVFVANVTDLTAWELRVDFDDKLLTLDDASYAFFLVSSGGSIFPALFEQEAPGRYFLAAADVQGTPESGSGVLARLSLTAKAKGKTTISVMSSPTVYGARLTGKAGAAIGDSNGDGIWDGSVVNGDVSIGSKCAPSTPVATPVPPKKTPPAATATPRPGETSAPGASPGTSGPDATGAAGSENEGATGGDGTGGDGTGDNGSGGDGGSGSGSSGSSGGTDGGSGEGDEGGAAVANVTGGEDDGSAADPRSPDEGDSGGLSVPWVAGGGVVTLVAALAALYVWRQRSLV